MGNGSNLPAGTKSASLRRLRTGANATDNRKTVKIVVIDEAGADKASFLVSEACELVNEGIERTA